MLAPLPGLPIFALRLVWTWEGGGGGIVLLIIDQFISSTSSSPSSSRQDLSASLLINFANLVQYH